MGVKDGETLFVERVRDAPGGFHGEVEVTKGSVWKGRIARIDFGGAWRADGLSALVEALGAVSFIDLGRRCRSDTAAEEERVKPHAARSANGMGFCALLVVLAVASEALVHFRSDAAEQAALPTTPRLPKGKVLTATRGSNRSVERIFDVDLPPPDLRNRDETNFSAVVGLLRPRERESKKFILPKLANIKALVAGDSTLRYEFRAPSGRRLALGATPDSGDYKSGGMGGLNFFLLERPEAGEWSVTVDATKSSDSASYGIVIGSDGPVEEQGHLEAMTRDSPESNASVRPGTLVYVRAFVLKGDRPVPGVEWNVTARTPKDSLLFIPVFDDGLHADGAANDGKLGRKRCHGRIFDINAGESRRIVTKWTPTSSDTYEVRLTIDPYLEPYESDYANNTRKTTVRVR